jgi:hypothetical protein
MSSSPPGRSLPLLLVLHSAPIRSAVKAVHRELMRKYNHKNKYMKTNLIPFSPRMNPICDRENVPPSKCYSRESCHMIQRHVTEY